MGPHGSLNPVPTTRRIQSFAGRALHLSRKRASRPAGAWEDSGWGTGASHWGSFPLTGALEGGFWLFWPCEPFLKGAKRGFF